jgi:hypothetical protein
MNTRASRLARAFRVVAAAFIAFYTALAAALVLPLEAHERCVTPAVSPAASSAALSALSDGDDAPAEADDAPAVEDARPAASFGGCGFLYPFQLGAAQYIAEAFDTSRLRLAGHSAGFAAAVTLAAGVPAELHWHVLLAARARWAGRALGPFLDATRAWMAPYAAALAPHEPAILAAAADGRLSLGYTRFAWTRGWPPARAGHAVACCFGSLAEFVYCITVSQRCMPFYRSPGWLHGAWGLDGAFSAQFTVPPGCSLERCLTVSPTNPLADVTPEQPLPPHWFVSLPDAAHWERLRQLGYEAAQAKHHVMLAKGFVPRRDKATRTDGMI